MAAPPRFDRPDAFDPAHLRLADFDGTGPTDLCYLAGDGPRIWRNQAGNGFTAPTRLTSVPPVDGQTTVTVTDLLGTGTACLVWSSTAPGDAARPVRYVDLTGGAKPYLLNTTRNNLGAETRLTYAPSTRFFLADRAAGRPWATRLPFPVHVVERVEVVDHVSRSRFVSRYAYHHGHFDGYEREFRGFGMVEQFDTEAFDAEQVHSAPPVLTRTWYHTGAYLGHHRIAMRFADEYHREPGTRVTDLADTVLPANLTADEEREACRALAGTVLRREVYALDGTDRQARPYTVSEQRYAVRLRQPRRGTAHAGFAVHPCESVQEHHERTRYQVAGAQVADPRISHTAVLDVDDFGNVLRSVAVAYGRAHPDPALPAAVRAEQGRVRITMSEQRYTNAVTAGAAYRTPVVAETRAYEILGVTASPAALFTVDGIGAFADAAGDGAHDVPAEDLDADPTGAPHRRLLSHTRVRYRRDDLNGPLPLGVVESLALPYTSQQLALTAGMVAAVHGAQVTDQMLTGAGYVHDADPHWWIPSGQVSFTAEPAAPAEEHEQARRHFFQPRRFTDAFGHPTTVAYDAHDLFPVEIQDPLGNRTTAGHDYRVLQPRLVTDANRNRVAAAFDTLGMVVGTAVLGKPGQEPGDSLDGFTADLTDAEIAADLADPLGTAQALLGAATTRVVYDIFAYWRSRDTDTPQGPVAHAMAREVHVGDLAPGQSSRIQHELVYSDGLGRPMQNKARVAAGPLTPDGPAVPVRWTGTGWTIRDNKGQPVRGYEPFFTATHRLEFARTAGVSSVACRDPLGRVVATLAPDHTWVKATFDPWRQESWDSNDTVLLDPATDTDVAGFTGRLDPDEYLPTWYDRRAGGALGPLEQAAAAKAASHAATPAVTHLDSLGRPVATIAHNRTADGVDERLTSLVEPDIAGRTRRVTDPLGRLVARYDHDLLGRRLAHDLMDAGRLRIVLDIAGQPCHTFDSRGQQHGVDYDALRRPTTTVLSTDGGLPVTVGRVVYGEALPDAEARNLRGAVHQIFDGAGVHTVERRDVKGNMLTASRRFAVDHRGTPDWSGPVALEAETFTTSSRYDALGRATQAVAPHDAGGPDPRTDVVQPRYDDGGLLDRIDVWSRRPLPAPEGLLTPDTADLHAVTGVEVDAKGQRRRVEHGNGVRTSYEYDPDTFRLRRQLTTRGATALQDLRYTYDPAGNVTSIRDEAQQTVFFGNQVVEPSAGYTYDALYRLVEATGREHLAGAPAPTGPTDAPRVGLAHPGDGTAMARYTERYAYDEVGNVVELVHQSTRAGAGWTRRFSYDGPGNRLTGARVGDGPAESYGYDAHGNMTGMPHLSVLTWDHADRLRSTARQVVVDGTPETTWYQYSDGGERLRKSTDRSGTAAAPATRAADRRYLGGFEIHREYAIDGVTVALERQTLHVADGTGTVAMIETRTAGTDPGAAQVTRFQYTNRLGSAVLELDAQAQVVSYEEYHPYGSTAYQAVRAQTEAPKRYRYTGKERDGETGLYYHGARYYAPWLARWTAPDPAGLVDGPNLYAYARGNPVGLSDPTGHQAVDPRAGSHTPAPAAGVRPPPPPVPGSTEAAYLEGLQVGRAFGQGFRDIRSGFELLTEHLGMEEAKRLGALDKFWAAVGGLPGPPKLDTEERTAAAYRGYTEGIAQGDAQAGAEALLTSVGFAAMLAIATEGPAGCMEPARPASGHGSSWPVPPKPPGFARGWATWRWRSRRTRTVPGPSRRQSNWRASTASTSVTT
ncbi:toxin TcdB middle/N-terminal domain-containing protein [Phytohabitans flavus]